MKKVFMPSMDELYKMQDLDVNLYKYLVVKTIESLIYCGVKNPNKGIFKSAPKYLRENPEIARAICMMYPDEMLFSEIARNDDELACILMNSRINGVSGLNYLCRFDTSVLSNPIILKNVLSSLEEELKNNPRYRFEYIGSESNYLSKGTGNLLDDIFSRNIGEDNLMCATYDYRKMIIKSLINIEPSYVIRLPRSCFDVFYPYSHDDSELSVMLGQAINNYSSRYKIPMSVGVEYLGKDILTNPDTNVKRLIKCINDRNK